MTTILIVDDELVSRDTVGAILEGRGYQLEMACDGAQAIEMASRLLPDLILLDVMMPDMDGYQVCQHLRADPRLAEVPVLIMTALADRESRLRGISAGADDFLAKPLDFQELVMRVGTIARLDRYRTLLKQRESLAAMAKRVLEAHEKERLHLSHEIQDDIAQALSAHQIALQALRDGPMPDEASWRQAAQDLVGDCAQMAAKLQAVAKDLRPPLLEALGIRPALRACCRDVGRRTGLTVGFEDNSARVPFPDIISVTLYRVLQEALLNSARHAQAGQAWVTLAADDAQIVLTVRDDGQGFVEGQSTGEGTGIQTMRERVTLAGGLFELRTSPGQGTTVAVTFSAGPDGWVGA